MVTRFMGLRRWGTAVRDEEGYRTYKPVFLVACDRTDGPANALQTPGLPSFGDTWQVFGDIDVYAWCRWPTTATPVVDDEANTYFLMEYNFSTKPPETGKCQSTQIENPLLIPPKVSGQTVKYTEEKAYDRFGNPILNSAFERLRGPQTEFDANRSSLTIEMNVPLLNEAFVESMKNTLNDAPIWGYPARCVKLSEFNWEKKYFGVCFFYYTWTLKFDRYVAIDPVSGGIMSGFDRDILDEGTKCILGHWDTNKTSPTFGLYLVNTDASGKPLLPSNPRNFGVFKDPNGENAKVILNSGLPAGVGLSGGSTTIVNLTTLVNGNLPIVGQPPAASTLTLQIPPVAGVEVLEGVLTLSGLNESNAAVQETFDLTEDATQYNSQYRYLQVTQVNVQLLDVSGGTLQITVFTNTSSIAPGRIHVEYYNESDFTTLGVPLVY